MVLKLLQPPSNIQELDFMRGELSEKAIDMQNIISDILV